MKRDHAAIRAELDRLTVNGVLHADTVLDAAREESSPLHPCFTWDDGAAAQQYRLIQARNIIRVYVTVETPESNPVRAFVSLTSDRSMQGGGYRTMASVLNDDQAKEQMLRDAFVQFRNMRQKYQHLQQLAGVWKAVDEAEGGDVANAA